MAPELVDHRGAAALELHDLEIDAGHHLEEFARQMLEAADARTSQQISWPGFCFASAMSSFTELAGTLGWTVSTAGPLPSFAIGVKDFTGSYGSL